MAFSGGYHEGTGSPVALSSILTSLPAKAALTRFAVRANPNNSYTSYMGGSSVSSSGVGAWVALSKSETFAHTLDGFDVKTKFDIDLDNTYVVAQGGDVLHIAYWTPE